MVIKNKNKNKNKRERCQCKNTLYSNSMQHDMPQSLLVFSVSFTPETPSFVTFGGVAHPPPP